MVINDINSAFNAAIQYHRSGQFDKAEEIYKEIIKRYPEQAEAHNNMGVLFQEQDRNDEALVCFRKVVSIRSNFAEAHYNMGNVYREQGRSDEAIKCYQRALDLNPKDIDSYNNMGLSLNNQGKIGEAIECYRKVLKIAPDHSIAHSNILFSMQHSAAYNQETIFLESKAWWQQHGASLTDRFKHKNSSDPEKRLRIGYVSPDFRQHSVSYFFLPLLAAHDRSQFEIFCYSNVKHADGMTNHVRELTDHWHSILGLSDDIVAEQIHKDGIDILVDLAGHTAGNRLLVFACKSAPVQVNWLGYPNTTGMPIMDYRLTDEITDPEGEADQYHSEKLIRLPHGFHCYSPPKGTPGFASLPSLETGQITFGSFNNMAKISEEVVAAWSKILYQVPKSSLLLKNKQLADESTRRHYLDMFSQNGISHKRIKMISYMPSTLGHMALYNKVDIGLDTFPYNGTTTTCEALWMGVPVITLCGNHHAARVSASLLTRIEMTELITQTEDEYVAKAVELAADLERLAELRACMRQCMMDSPLCNPESFARDVETAFRNMWNVWCIKKNNIKDD